ncbi:hypothetical protein SOVF_156710 [Spinacia oleracea]|nr:hypothetical protein SOVF_156710 [Spinacia oleracea]
MTGEEICGPPGNKVFRLLSFAGAGVICTFAINKWREIEGRRVEENEKQQNQLTNDSQSNAVLKVVK